MTLPPGDLLASIVVPIISDFSRLDGLAVDAAGAGVLVLSEGDPHRLAQGVEDLLPGAIVAPLGEVFVDGALGRQVVRQHVPLAAGAIDVEDRVDHFPEINLARPSHLGDGDQRPDDFPLRVGQVAGVGLTHRDMLRSGRAVRIS